MGKNRVFNKVTINVAFTEPTTREKIKSGEHLSTLMGKISKYFTDLKTVAFSGKMSDLSELVTNSASADGVVAKGTGQVKKVWKTDAAGNPGWRDPLDSADTIKVARASMSFFDITYENVLRTSIQAYTGYESVDPVTAAGFYLSGKGNTVDMNAGGKARFYSDIGSSGDSTVLEIGFGGMSMPNTTFEISAGASNTAAKVKFSTAVEFAGGKGFKAALTGSGTFSAGVTRGVNPIFVDTNGSNTLMGIDMDNSLCFYSATEFDDVDVYGGLYVYGNINYCSNTDISMPNLITHKNTKNVSYIPSSTSEAAIRVYSGTSTTSEHTTILGARVYAQSLTSNSAVADYAEYLEWKDKNLNSEDRVGKFVTLSGEKIAIANAGDYIIGAVSGNPAVIGGAARDSWVGKYVRDNFGRLILGDLESVDPETGEITTLHNQPQISTGYDDTMEYIPREARPEWDTVGMLGVLRVYDDGTCTEDGWCKVADGGIATKAEVSEYSFLTPVFKVMKRVSDDVIQIFFK